MLYDHILVPYDGSVSAKAALAEATRYAKDDPGARLSIIQIVDTELLLAERLKAEKRPTNSTFTPVVPQADYEAAIAELHDAIVGLLPDLMNELTVEFLEETEPGEQIVAYAEEGGCDLIIMGWRGLGALRGILGSVSNYVLREAHMPVLIVKHRAER